MFQTPEPVMRTVIIMFRSLVLCTYSDFCQSLISLGCSNLLPARQQLRSLRLWVSSPSSKTYPWGALSHTNLHPDASCLGAICRFCILVLWAFTLHTKSTPTLSSMVTQDLGTDEGDLMTSLIALLPDLMTPMFSGKLKIWGMLETSSSYINQIP